MNTAIQDAAILEQQDMNEAPEMAQAPWLARFMSTLNLSETLRFLGAFAVLASMSVFLMNGWSEGNDIQRYLKLLAQTGLLTGGGLVLGFLAKDYKGARVFFGLSLVSVVANFTILGALLYSFLQWDSALVDYPAALTWQVVDQAVFWPLLAATLVALTVLTKFSFAIFARRSSTTLSAAFLASCATLLIPLRDSFAVSTMLVISAFFMLHLVKQIRAKEDFVATTEAKFAVGMLFVPMGVMLARALSLYHANEILMVTLCSLALFGLRFYQLQKSRDEAAVPGIFDRCLVFLQLGIAWVLAFNVLELLPTIASFVPQLVLTSLLLLNAAEFALSKRQRMLREIHLFTSTLLLVIINVVCALFEQLFIHVAVALLISIGLVVLARIAGRSINVANTHKLALIGAALCGLLLARSVFLNLELLNPMVLGGLGGLLILLATGYERLSSR